MNHISAIIPNYNRAALIGKTIANLLAQTRPPDEIIVVDDGSTDHSVAVIESFCPKVKLIRQANQGPGAARNAGLRAATGDLIQFQDSDDLYSLNKLDVQSRLLESSGADIAFSPWVKVRIEGRRVTFENHVLQQRMPPGKLPLSCWWLRGWSTVFQSLMFRRGFLNRVGFYRTDLMPSEDSEYFFRALMQSPRTAFSPEALTIYRVHEINKITQDQGTSRSRRIVDWARCLRHVIAHGKNARLRPDATTRAIFLHGVRKQLRYLRTVPEHPNELETLLVTEAARMPGAWLDAVGLWLRATEQLRLRTRGSRWMPGYQPAAPTSGQCDLIRQLGFDVD